MFAGRTKCKSLRIANIHNIAHYKQHQSMSNIEATQSIKNLYMKQESNKNYMYVLQNAAEIYNNIYEERNHFVINTLLKLLCTLNLSNSKNNWLIDIIWNDVDTLNKQNDNKYRKHVSYPLLISCYAKFNNFDVKRC
eukprot:140522_1